MMPAFNDALLRSHPAAHALLNDAGRRAVFPADITAQSAQARHCALRATIGQFTRGDGTAFSPPALSRHVQGLHRERTFLYGPVGGHPTLRRAWADRMRSQGAGTISSPLVVNGITNGLSLVADLFADADTTLVAAEPFWGNYRLVFGLSHEARLRTFPFFSDGRFNTQGLRETLASVTGKAILLLNFPGNPTGFSPADEDVQAIVDAVAEAQGPLLVVTDDAYKGMVFEPGVLRTSLAPRLAQALSPDKALVVSVDGCTKELMFFGGRVGFVTFHGVDEQAAAVLDEKARTMQRASINIPSGPAQELALAALEDPGLEGQLSTIFDMLDVRYRVLKDELSRVGGPLHPYPFNSGFFALVGVDRAIDVEELRLRLIRDHSVGLIAIRSVNALRIAFCSIDSNDIPEMVRRVRTATGG